MDCQATSLWVNLRWTCTKLDFVRSTKNLDVLLPNTLILDDFRWDFDGFLPFMPPKVLKANAFDQLPSVRMLHLTLPLTKWYLSVMRFQHVLTGCLHSDLVEDICGLPILRTPPIFGFAQVQQYSCCFFLKANFQIAYLASDDISLLLLCFHSPRLTSNNHIQQPRNTLSNLGGSLGSCWSSSWMGTAWHRSTAGLSKIGRMALSLDGYSM